MYIDFSKLFHRASKDHSDKERVHIPQNHSEWPQAWKTIFYKTYKNMAKLPFPKNTSDSPLFKLIGQRKSEKDFTKKSLSPENLSDILKYSCGEIDTALPNAQPRRAYPSAGARYPVEAYVIVFYGSHTLPAGLYHYNVQNHSLDVMQQREFTTQDIRKLFTYGWVQNASAAIVLTGVFSRAKMKYGQRGYRYALLEAGHIGQNIYLTSQALGIGCSSMGGTLDTALEQLLQIDGENESVLYSLILGK